jgi:SAM-dependent methyltransferase
MQMLINLRKKEKLSACETQKDFVGYQDWIKFREEQPELCNQATFQQWAQQILSHGCIEPLTEQCATGASLENRSALREGLSFEGVSSRVRAVMLVIAHLIQEQGLHSPKIYAAEATTPFALRLRGLYPHFIGSEFTLDPAQREEMYPIPFEDLLALTLKTDAFDIVSTNEVLEHVPSIEKALAELCRVLRPGGWHVGTVPFDYFGETSIKRAEMDGDGNIIHLMEPEYHGDPMNDKGVLVFEIAGWNILNIALEAGFSRAFMRFIISHRHGIVDEHIGGVFVLCCQK